MSDKTASMSENIAYLDRRFARLSQEAVQAAQQGRMRVMAEATQRGVLHGGRMSLLVKDEYVRAATDAAVTMARTAYDVTGSTDQPVCDVVSKGLSATTDTLFDDLVQFFQIQRAVSTGPSMFDFRNEMNRLIRDTLDDFRHGFVGGNRLTKNDPLVNVISNITNSPGAVLQSGVSNVQNATAATFAADAVRSALTQLLNSQEVQSLPPDDKQSFVDVAEVLRDELDKPQPDKSKILRWGGRLIGMAQQLGIAVVASGLSHVLFG
jgi:hypothetical protein